MPRLSCIYPNNLKNRFLGINKRTMRILCCCGFLISVCAAQCAETPMLESLNRRLNRLQKTFHRTANPSALLAPGPFAQVDLLFWQAREDGLSYAIIASQPLVLEILPRDFEVKEPEFEWDFAFRLGAGYGGKGDGFDLFAQWTRFVTDAHDLGRHSLSTDKFFLPIWAHPDFNIFLFDHITEAEAHWDLHFDEIDAGIGRAFYISKFFTVRPFVGPSSVWIHQHYKIEYEKPAIFGVVPVRKDHIHLKNEFFGLGAKGGCELRFHFNKGLSLMTRAAAAIYAGRFEVQRKEKFESTIEGNRDFDIHQVIRAGRAATSLESGLCWEHSINHHKAYVRAELCYDLAFFFKQNQLPRVISPILSPPTFLSDQGDLTLHGGSFSITVGF